MYFRFTDIDQSQQALRNYPANSPANIAGGGLPAGATGYQAHPDPDHQRRDWASPTCSLRPSSPRRF